MFSLLAFLIFAQPPVIPDQQVTVGQLVQIKPGKQTKFFTVHDGLTIVPGIVLADPESFVAIPTKAGTFRVLAYTQTGGNWEPTLFTIVVKPGTPGPDPVVPPMPDNPPEPEVDISKDPLLDGLKGILGGLQEPQQKENLAKLSKAYAKGATLAAQSPDFGTWSQSMRAASKAEGVPGTAILAIRQRLQDEITAVLGTDQAAPFAGGLGDKAGKLAIRISKILAELAK